MGDVNDPSLTPYVAIRAYFYPAPGLGITQPNASFDDDRPQGVIGPSSPGNDTGRTAVQKMLDALDSYKGPVAILRFAGDKEWLDAVIALNRRIQAAQRDLMTGGAVIVGGTASRDIWNILAQWPDGYGWRVQIERQTLTAQVAPRPQMPGLELLGKQNGRG